MSVGVNFTTDVFVAISGGVITGVCILIGVLVAVSDGSGTVGVVVALVAVGVVVVLVTVGVMVALVAVGFVGPTVGHATTVVVPALVIVHILVFAVLVPVAVGGVATAFNRFTVTLCKNCDAFDDAADTVACHAKIAVTAIDIIKAITARIDYMRFLLFRMKIFFSCALNCLTNIKHEEL